MYLFCIHLRTSYVRLTRCNSQRQHFPLSSRRRMMIRSSLSGGFPGSKQNAFSDFLRLPIFVSKKYLDTYQLAVRPQMFASFQPLRSCFVKCIKAPPTASEVMLYKMFEDPTHGLFFVHFPVLSKTNRSVFLSGTNLWGKINSGIRTYNLSILIILPLPPDQGSPPIKHNI